MDQLNLQVREASEESGGGFEVQIFVNGVEMTSAGAGLGMDPTDLLFPENKLRPSSEPHEVPVARCSCGSYGCGATDVLIIGEAERVHWVWLIEKPVNGRVTFDLGEYSAEIDRFENDRSWETPERTALRLIMPVVLGLPSNEPGLVFSWAGNYYAAPEIFLVTFTFDDVYQVFVRAPWEGRTPKEMAERVEDILRTEPQTWDAMWSGMTREARDVRPIIAGPAWTKYPMM